VIPAIIEPAIAIVAGMPRGSSHLTSAAMNTAATGVLAKDAERFPQLSDKERPRRQMGQGSLAGWGEGLGAGRHSIRRFVQSTPGAPLRFLSAKLLSASPATRALCGGGSN
jgi:hypothetical protein